MRKLMRVRVAPFAFFVFALTVGELRAEPPALPTTVATPGPLNLALPTLGGEQFWSDELVYQGWRIQRNALTEHCRLLDSREVRRAYGTYDQCRSAFDEVRRHEMLPPLHGRAVVTLHGLVRSRDHMEGLGRFLSEQGNY